MDRDRNGRCQVTSVIDEAGNLMSSQRARALGADGGASSVHGYESVWNGRELIYQPPPPRPTSKICRQCWRRRPLRDFDKRRICRECVRLRNSARLREYRETARARGFCQACLKRPAAGGLTICEGCQQRHREQNVERRQRLGREGRCVSCTASLPPGWKAASCRACVDYLRRRMVELRQSRLAAGLCRACGTRPRAVLVRGELATRCRRCLDRAVEGKRTRAARHARLGEAGA